jgi:hypothetical protein
MSHLQPEDTVYVVPGGRWHRKQSCPKSSDRDVTTFQLTADQVVNARIRRCYTCVSDEEFSRVYEKGGTYANKTPAESEYSEDSS